MYLERVKLITSYLDLFRHHPHSIEPVAPQHHLLPDLRHPRHRHSIKSPIHLKLIIRRLQDAINGNITIFEFK